MSSPRPLSRLLRATALVVLVAGLGTWAATGAHRGWTQTSVVTLQKDEVTGIEYPVRRAGFIAGVEVPLAATGLAAVLTALSFLRRRATPTPA